MIRSDRCLRLTPLPGAKYQQSSRANIEAGVHTALGEISCPYEIPYQADVGDGRHTSGTH